jgi:hypothetical protein
MNPIQALKSALTSKEIHFLEIARNECRRKAATSRNDGFKRWWTQKSKAFDRRIKQVKQGEQNGSEA